MKKTLFSLFALASTFNVYADESRVLFHIETKDPTTIPFQRAAINC